MTMYGLPFLIYNMGGEMLYILQQRLQAQEIPAEKSLRVLQEVSSTMLSRSFREQLMKPQELYSMVSTRKIFDKVAHSSIMRLSENSMDKLFDLMSMAFKYQLISCSQPQEILQITLNHLDVIQSIVKNTKIEKDLEATKTEILNIAEKFTYFDYFILRKNLLSFFQDKRVKVSLFLEQGIQSKVDGTVIIPVLQLPMGFERPGTIKYFNYMGQAEIKTVDHKLANIQENFVNHLDTSKRTSTLGTNMYMQQRPKNVAPSEPIEETITQETQESEMEEEKPTPNELDFLASLIGATKRKHTESTFKLSLFSNTESFVTPKKEIPQGKTIVFDRTTPKGHGIDLDFDNLETKKEETDDLFDLIDNE